MFSTEGRIPLSAQLKTVEIPLNKAKQEEKKTNIFFFLAGLSPIPMRWAAGLLFIIANVLRRSGSFVFWGPWDFQLFSGGPARREEGRLSLLIDSRQLSRSLSLFLSSVFSLSRSPPLYITLRGERKDEAQKALALRAASLSSERPTRAIAGRGNLSRCVNYNLVEQSIQRISAHVCVVERRDIPAPPSSISS